MVREHVFVEGLVQGVGFRYHTQKKGTALGLTGWVRNLTDGRVEILVEGPADSIEQFMKWVGKGPSSAQVESVQKALAPSKESLKEGVFSVR